MLGSDQYTTNIRLNTSALPEKIAHQMLMQKDLAQENLTKSIQLEFKSLHEIEHIALEMLKQKYLAQENLTKSIQLELKSLKEVEHKSYYCSITRIYPYTTVNRCV